MTDVVSKLSLKHSDFGQGHCLARKILQSMQRLWQMLPSAYCEWPRRNKTTESIWNGR